MLDFYLKMRAHFTNLPPKQTLRAGQTQAALDGEFIQSYHELSPDACSAGRKPCSSVVFVTGSGSLLDLAASAQD